MTGRRPRAALFGGTFDPFHHAHLRMAVEAREALGLDRVVLLPARQPPHKPSRPVSDAAHRLAMTRAATAGLPGFEVSDLELRRPGPSYSVDTVSAFRDAAPGTDVCFLMGADSFAEIATWHRYRELLALCDVVLLPRSGPPAEPAAPEGVRVDKMTPHCYSWTGSAYRLPGGTRLLCPALPALDISSSAVREKVRAGKCIRGLVAPEVERYITENRLYTEPATGGRP